MSLRVADVQRSLEAVEKRMNSILDDRASVVIEEARSMLRASKERFDDARSRTEPEAQQSTWGYSIKPNNPLRFRDTEIDGLKLRVDLFLQAFWSDEPAESPSILNVVIRVWCLDKSVCYRADWDAESVEDRIQPGVGRVLLRLHFDLANPHQAGPKYHLQIGGKPADEELHWFPKALSLPRILHMPVDLVLASEMIAANFYPEAYKKLRREDMWIGARKVSQGHLLHGYVKIAKEAIASNESVLDALWNTPWE